MRLLIVALASVAGVLALSVPVSARPACATEVLRDAVDGRFDRAYQVRCYREALASLPTDARLYTNAEAEIERALNGRLIQLAAQRGSRASSSGSTGIASPTLLLALAGGALTMVAAIAAGAVYGVRRCRRRSIDE